MSKISIGIADDNPIVCHNLVEQLSEDGRFEVVGVAANGFEVLQLVQSKQPQILLLDLVMPKLDGMSALERLATQGSLAQTRVIVITAMMQDDIILRCVSLGAAYVMAKPYRMEQLMHRISSTASGYEDQKKSDPNRLESGVLALFNQLGIPPHTKGRQYLQRAVTAIHQDQTLLRQITTSLYPLIAKETMSSPQSVERAIRHTIKLTLERGCAKQLEYTFGQYYTSQQNLTNGEFIASLVHASKDFT